MRLHLQDWGSPSEGCGRRPTGLIGAAGNSLFLRRDNENHGGPRRKKWKPAAWRPFQWWAQLPVRNEVLGAKRNPDLLRGPPDSGSVSVIKSLSSRSAKPRPTCSRPCPRTRFGSGRTRVIPAGCPRHRDVRHDARLVGGQVDPLCSTALWPRRDVVSPGCGRLESDPAIWRGTEPPPDAVATVPRAACRPAPAAGLHPRVRA
jgi:hypothetical protein